MVLPTLGTSCQRTFRKTYHEDFSDELTKAQWFEAVATQSGCFTAPRIVAVHGPSGEIEYEWVDCSYSLEDLLDDPQASDDLLMERHWGIGRVLASIHMAASFPGGSVATRPWRYNAALRHAGHDVKPRSTDEMVPQHGDFGFSNIFFAGTGATIVIDPSPNGYSSLKALNLDFPEADLALLVSNLIGRTRRVRVMTRTARFGRRLAAAVVEGYESAGPPVDRARLRGHTAATIESFRLTQDPWRRLLLPVVTGLFGRNLP